MFLGLGCAMVTSLVLGMGVFTTSNYIITSTVAAPILIQLGIPIYHCRDAELCSTVGSVISSLVVYDRPIIVV